MDIEVKDMSMQRRKGTAALSILKELGTTSKMLTYTTTVDEMDWDLFCPMFMKIVALAGDIVELDQKVTAEKRSDCINMAIVRPLFEVSLEHRPVPEFSPVRTPR